jgi:hypothetical protein
VHPVRWLRASKASNLIPRKTRVTKKKARTTAEIVAASVTEAAFTTQVMELAHALGWLVHHTHDSRTNHWSTDKGLPDIVAARDGRTVMAELKRVGQKPRPEQRAWLEAAGGYCWTPLDWDDIVLALRT